MRSFEHHGRNIGRNIGREIVIAATGLLDYLMPAQCFVCGLATKSSTRCCEVCYPDLPFAPRGCQRCGQRLSRVSSYCGKCLQNPPAWDACFCAFDYTFPISDRIKAFKYQQRPDYAASLAHMLATEIDSSGLALPDAIVPVPAHSSRIRERGYNQASLLAHKLARDLGLPCLPDAIKKIRATKAQSELPLARRKANLKGCFSAETSLDFNHIAIVDDVVTSGATAAEMTKTLRQKGVDYVQVWGLAHTDKGVIDASLEGK